MPRNACPWALARLARAIVWLAAVTPALALTSAVVAEESPLHARIDALLESSAPGPLVPPASDADFLRRVYLDLTGKIPDAATARAFLDDASPTKRSALVDRLLNEPRFAQHMRDVFDVMWMERRPAKNIPLAEWREYLRQSFAQNKPLDVLAREILAADGVDPKLRPAARFYLDREGDPHLVTRDLGRLFFGRDMQCAQCHDHPLIDDYLQADYYGLQAFVSRGSLFVDDKEKKTYYAESAEGEVKYSSVFTGEARDHVVPKLPGSAPVSEPLLAKDEAYVVAPAKGVRPVPKYSRRQQLAALATSGTNAAFNRNLANRLWAQMMGRGLNHPLDMEHSDNPAVQSELLTLLADELVRMKFDTRAFLRELALTRAYQRTSEVPAAAEGSLDNEALAARLTQWKAQIESLAATLPALEEATKTTDTALDAAYEEFSKKAAAREAAGKARAEAKKASDDISAALQTAIKDVAAKEDILKSLVEARDKSQAAAAKLPEDKPLAEAAGQFAARAGEFETQLAAGRKLVTDKTAEVQTASLKLAECDKALEQASAELTAARNRLEGDDNAARSALAEFRAAKALHGELTARAGEAQLALDWRGQLVAANASQAAAQAAGEQLASLQSQNATDEVKKQAADNAAAASEKAATDRAAAEAAWTRLLEKSETRFALASLKPLSPEQLCWSTMQALGLIETQRAALAPEVQQALETKTDLSAEARAAEEARLLATKIDEKLSGNVNSFVGLFGQQPGQAPTFQATVHQALFLSNGGLLASWLNPSGNNLTERLAKLEAPAAVADEMYLSVLTRPPTEAEQAQVAAYWQAAGMDRAAAAREMVWALVTSAEFRFNH